MSVLPTILRFDGLVPSRNWIQTPQLESYTLLLIWEGSTWAKHAFNFYYLIENFCYGKLQTSVKVTTV